MVGGDLYDYIAIMDYRDKADGRDGIIRHAANEMEYAAEHGKKVVIGVDVTHSDMKKLSFEHLTAADMERELSRTVEAYGKSPAFAGFAIHHLVAYEKWMRRQKKR